MASPALPPLGWAIAHDPAGQFVANGAGHRTIGGSWRTRRRLPSPAPTKGTDAPRPRPIRRRRVAAGDRVELVSTSDPSTRLRPGDRGTVTGIGHIPGDPPEVQVHLVWDSGSTLAMLPGAGDQLRKRTGDQAAAK
jgi:hypothetical protein